MVCNGNQGTYFTKDRNTAASANQAKSSHKLSLVSIIAKTLFENYQSNQLKKPANIQPY